ncbi:unnamed protein product [Phytomonas sp. Hart1]|nr:unnamed protein product [Phytomonas sp. Hart1]|eukprot:CCW66752.1 unnamed protein product [Phytomonas sp. isolate Hart1]
MQGYNEQKLSRKMLRRYRFLPNFFSPKSHRAFKYDSFEEEVEDEVIVFMNDPAKNKEFKYPTNFISTSKYTYWSFLPVGLFYQFTNISNFYFLIHVIFSLIPGVSPITPITSILPLMFVLSVALCREGVEDVFRHQADKRVNSLVVDVIRGGMIVSIPSFSVVPGDIVRISNGDEIAADMILLSSSMDEGQAFIDTCNLDGETNLKSRKALEATWNLTSVEEFTKNSAVLYTTPPDSGLLSWMGVINLNGTENSMSLEQFLYRGCILKNTEWAWGMVVYTGVNTKLFKNLKKKPFKSSSLKRKMDLIILIIFIMQNIILFTFCIMAYRWYSKRTHVWYLSFYLPHGTMLKYICFRYLTYIILLSYLIPISLFVTIDLCKVVQAYWMRVDYAMMECIDGKIRGCRVNTSNLNEQLALVKFIFTDKTGTLTENVMQFKCGDALGVSIGSDNLNRIFAELDPFSSEYSAVYEYFLSLALCNTIHIFKTEDKPLEVRYGGPSTDEKALVEAAAEAGFRMVHRTIRCITLEIGARKREFNILATLEFTPERKMMSIIVEDALTGKITLFNKGADSFVKPQLSHMAHVQDNFEKAEIALNNAASMGLRTLLVSARDLSLKEFERWHKRYEEASKLLQNRSEAVDSVCLEIERDMRLIGMTAIEDRLQDEVPETLSFFLKAGVLIWMLTGDRRETAVAVQATTTLLDPRNDFIDHIDIGSLDPSQPEARNKVRADLKVIEMHQKMKGKFPGKRCTFVVDGVALTIAMKHHYQLFLHVSQIADSAICCRLTPLQKASVVRMFQKETGMTALAIGDGVNDVAMLQEGRVGVGIIGLEGVQAALESDYAIPRFKHLRRLCAVHGRYALVRNSSCIFTSYYKNFTLAILQVIFAFYTGFSGMSLFDGWLLILYNIALTALPPFLLGILEKDLPEKILLNEPILFSSLVRGQYFNIRILLSWIVEALVLAFLIFYTAYPILHSSIGGRTIFITGSVGSAMIYMGLIFCVLMRFTLSIRYWNSIQAFGILFSFGFTIVIIIIYSGIPILFDSPTVYWCIYNLASSAVFWGYLLLWISILTGVLLSIFHYKKRFFRNTYGSCCF